MSQTDLTAIAKRLLENTQEVGFCPELSWTHLDDLCREYLRLREENERLKGLLGNSEALEGCGYCNGQGYCGYNRSTYDCPICFGSGKQGEPQ